MLKHWSVFTRILNDRPRQRVRDATSYTLIATAKLNGMNPQASLADVLARIDDRKITDLAALAVALGGGAG